MKQVECMHRIEWRQPVWNAKTKEINILCMNCFDLLVKGGVETDG